MTSEEQIIYDDIYGLDRLKSITPTQKEDGRSHAWKGGRVIHMGYAMVMVRNHPSATRFGYVFEHVLVAERAMGRFLKHGEQVHHANGVRLDNRNENLVVCDSAFHRTLHRRTDAFKACGNPEWIKCPLCKQYDAPENLRLRLFKDSGQIKEGRHRECDARYKMNMRGRLTPNYQYNPKEQNGIVQINS